MKRFSSMLWAVAGVSLGLASAARAAVETVTTTADSGPGSLRNAIAAANSGDTIVFSSTLAGQTIELTSGELTIVQNLAIDASGLPGGIVIDGGGSSRVLEISGANVTINALTVTNGYVNDNSGAGVLLDDTTASLTARNCIFSGNLDGEDGGAISTYGTLTLYNCTVSDNSSGVFGGGIIGYGGAVTLNSCTLSGNFTASGGGGGVEIEFGALTLDDCIVSSNVATDFGGGVDVEDESSLALTNCVFLGNSSGVGGALSTENPATVSNCTFSNNISTNGAGGGIVNYGTMTLNNCTLSGNSVTGTNGLGGGLINSGTLTMYNCTLSGNSATSGNGGGIYNYQTLAMYNCTVSANAATNGEGGGLCNNDGSATLTLTNTIIAGNFAATYFYRDVAGLDVYRGVANFIDGNPELAPLGNYGGPTATMPPMPGSPVIDAGMDSVTNFLATDQRGYPRLAGAHVDIGAVEARYFVVLNTNDSGGGSLRATLTNSLDFVTFTNTLSGQTIGLTSGEILVTNSVTIDASTLQGGVIIDAGKNSRVMEISNATVTLNSLTLTNGYIGGNGTGGGIEVDSGCELSAINCVVSGNFANLGGSGIECSGATITLSHCSVSGNSGYGGGGGIEDEYGSATLSDCTLSSNSVPAGGAVYCYDGQLTLSNCVVSFNSADDGGGIDSGAATLTLNNCSFTGNSAGNIGGGINGGGLEGGTLAATNCTFTDNSANTGGAMEWGGLGTLDNCTISSNLAANAAGILNDYGTLTLSNCALASNTATNGGGGAISSGAFLTANSCTFSWNSGTNAGAIANSFEMTLNDCTVFSNSATAGNGGGIYNYWNLTVSNCIFSRNTAASGQGGGIYNWHTLTLDNSTFYLNSAVNGGGIADSFGGGDFSGSILTANACTFYANKATDGGGILNVVNMMLNNCTFSDNSADFGFGGAIYSQSADATYGYYPSNFLNNCTVYGNFAPGGTGGGLYSDGSSSVALTNTIVAGNNAGFDNDVFGTYFGAANFIGGNPQLAGLGDYGGPTPTVAPEFGSPVIDAGTDWVTNLLVTDQRGFPRLAGAHVDIGAVEARTAPANDHPVLRNAAYSPGSSFFLGQPATFQFSFTNIANADFTVLASTNLSLPLAKWTELGNASQPISPGQFEFDDTVSTTTLNGVTTTPQKFYRVVSP